MLILWFVKLIPPNSTQIQHGRKSKKRKHRETLGFTVFSMVEISGIEPLTS